MVLLSVLLFLAELIFWAGVGRAGFIFARTRNFPAPLLWGIIAAALVIVLWGFFMSPKASTRLTKIPRILAMVTAMGATGASLIALGERGFGLLVLLSAAVAAIGQWVVYEN